MDRVHGGMRSVKCRSNPDFMSIINNVDCVVMNIVKECHTAHRVRDPLKPPSPDNVFDQKGEETFLCVQMRELVKCMVEISSCDRKVATLNANPWECKVMWTRRRNTTQRRDQTWKP